MTKINKKIEIEKAKKKLEELKDKINKRTYNKFYEDLSIDNYRIDKYTNIIKKLDMIKDNNFKSLNQLNIKIKEDKKIVEDFKKKINKDKNIKKINVDKIVDDLNNEEKLKLELSLNKDINISSILNIFNKLNFSKRKFFLKTNNNFIPFNNNFLDKIKFLDKELIIDDKLNGSDYAILKSLLNIEEFKIIAFDNDFYKETRKQKRGAFFNMFIKDDYKIDLSYYQIFYKILWTESEMLNIRN